MATTIRIMVFDFMGAYLKVLDESCRTLYFDRRTRWTSTFALVTSMSVISNAPTSFASDGEPDARARFAQAGLPSTASLSGPVTDACKSGSSQTPGRVECRRAAGAGEASASPP